MLRLGRREARQHPDFPPGSEADDIFPAWRPTCVAFPGAEPRGAFGCSIPVPYASQFPASRAHVLRTGKGRSALAVDGAAAKGGDGLRGGSARHEGDQDRPPGGQKDVTDRIGHRIAEGRDAAPSLVLDRPEGGGDRPRPTTRQHLQFTRGLDKGSFRITNTGKSSCS